jgi:superfamily II DNA or RNA helicase
MSLNTNILNTYLEQKRGYLGQKGYTLLKKDLSPQQEHFIKKELMIKPYTAGAPGGGDQVVFPVYRESASKIYVPRYFGEKHFGGPSEVKISEGTDINIEFAGELRDYQKPVVQKYLDHVINCPRGTGGGLLELPCAYGKTVLSLKIISALKKKTLIIVHKEFLMNQWIERIEQFLPSAKVGKIQGPTIDIEDKDIVIGMLQSLSMKEYPSSTFDSFGLTIIDEVHHISSQTFSNALFKIVTKYMLGLSATMNRKDGTTDVFKMFLGEVIFKGKSDEEFDVIVRGITYEVDDPEFNTVVTDYKGNVQYSTMISKLCAYNRRSEFILKVVSDMVKENPDQQIMIIAHNRCILTYFYDAIIHRNIATVGYYVGGMKEVALKESESKKIILATYSMAAEGLDIKSLTTLVMSTPKTDIEQTVGRILREKHSQPIVVDIIDSHQPFQNQWTKRKVFYKKQNYKIIQTDSKNYDPNTSKWTATKMKKCAGGSAGTSKDKDIELPGTCLLLKKK